MKTVLRILLILVISLLVVGGTYGLSQTSWGAQQGFGRRPPGEQRLQPNADGQLTQAETARESTQPERRRPEGGRAAQEFTIFGLLSFLPVLLQLSVVIGAVSLIKRWSKRKRTKIGSVENVVPV